MPWFKVDDGFHGHPKVVDLSLEAIGLWTLAGSWCSSYLTDGEVTKRAMQRLGGTLDAAAELIGAGLWLASGDGFQFKDWEDYQPSKEQVEAERAAARKRQKDWRSKRKGTRDQQDSSDEVPPDFDGSHDASNGVTDGVTSDVGNAVTSPAPTPSLSRPLPDPSSTPNGVDIGAQNSPPKRAPETRLPDDWEPTLSARKYASMNAIHLGHEVEQFRNHAAANDRRQRNWDAAFRTWLGNAKKWSRPQQSPMSRTEQNMSVVQRLAAQEAEESRLEIGT